jgi:hypothetical protein
MIGSPSKAILRLGSRSKQQKTDHKAAGSEPVGDVLGGGIALECPRHAPPSARRTSRRGLRARELGQAGGAWRSIH